MQSVSRLIQHLKARPGDLSWTVTMLSTLKEQAKIDCPIFELDYVAPPRHTKLAQADAGLSKELADTEGFFSKLPPLSLAMMKKTKIRTLLTPKERQQHQIAKEKGRLAALQAQLQKREAELPQSDDDSGEIGTVRLGKRSY